MKRYLYAKKMSNNNEITYIVENYFKDKLDEIKEKTTFFEYLTNNKNLCSSENNCIENEKENKAKILNKLLKHSLNELPDYLYKASNRKIAENLDEIITILMELLSNN